MTNQVFSWSLFIVPWLTLLFIKRDDIKRYMPVAILAALLTTVIHDIGINLGFWMVRENAFPLYEMLPYFFGLIPVLTIWIFKFTNGRFRVYSIVNIIFDVGFVYFFLGWLLPIRGIYELTGITKPQVLLINIVHFSILYLYQKWQEWDFTHIKEASREQEYNLAPAKPLRHDDQDDK